MIRFLVNSSALWRVLRQAELRAAWSDGVSAGAVGSCHPQRLEFRKSARTLDEYEQMTEMFAALYPRRASEQECLAVDGISPVPAAA